MIFAHTLGSTRYTFGSLRKLLAKATPLRSGDALAGFAAQSAGDHASAQPCFPLDEARRCQLTGVTLKAVHQKEVRQLEKG